MWGGGITVGGGGGVNLIAGWGWRKFYMIR